jgi:hypothetical protein
MRRASYRDANHYRARAEECRTIAERFLDNDTRKKMLKVATDYERMADSAYEVTSVVDESDDEVTPVLAQWFH